MQLLYAEDKYDTKEVKLKHWTTSIKLLLKLMIKQQSKGRKEIIFLIYYLKPSFLLQNEGFFIWSSKEFCIFNKFLK
jgi:hypothetical protein